VTGCSIRSPAARRSNWPRRDRGGRHGALGSRTERSALATRPAQGRFLTSAHVASISTEAAAQVPHTAGMPWPARKAVGSFHCVAGMATPRQRNHLGRIAPTATDSILQLPYGLEVTSSHWSRPFRLRALSLPGAFRISRLAERSKVRWAVAVVVPRGADLGEAAEWFATPRSVGGRGSFQDQNPLHHY
jgi:hypothetical protein